MLWIIFHTLMDQIIEYFTKLWLSEKESEILYSLYCTWARPASAISKQVNMERTLCYKHLSKLSQQGIIKEVIRKWTTYFYTDKAHSISKLVEQKQKQSEQLNEQLPIILQELEKLNATQFSFAPHIQLFDGQSGIEQLYEDILKTTLTEKRWVIKVLANNTIDTISLSTHTLQNYAKKTFQELRKHKINTEIYLADGVNIMQEFRNITNSEDLLGIPAWNSAINIYLIGHTLYIVIFDDLPYGIKIHSRILATLMHFIIDKIQVSP